MKKRIYYNAKFITLDADIPHAEAVYIEDGRIKGIGSNEEILLQYGRSNVERIDLQNGFAFPGLVDNHLHLSAHGMKLSMLDFSQVRSKAEMLELLRKKVRETPVGEWVLGLNWNENQFADRSIPTIAELDEIAPNHPLFLTRTCYHTYLANHAAFQKAGLGEDAPDPADGSYGRDAAGRLNGLVYENASLAFLNAQPKPSYAQLKEYARLGMEDALSLGLTGVHTDELRLLGSIRNLLQIYRELREEGIYVHTNQLIYHPFLAELEELGMTTGDGDEWLKIGACKIFSDGAIGGRTALLSEPYHDDPNTYGQAIHTQEELNQITSLARKLKMPIAVHAIGDQGAEMTIRAMEAYPLQKYRSGNVRDRLIHGQVLRKDLIERLQRLPVAIDIQPRFVASDFPWVMERLGPHRLDYAYAWRKLLDAGLRCGGGSDAPIEPLDPRLGIHAAITRRNPEEEQHEGYLPSEKLTAREALTLFTLGAAYTAGEEESRGSISVGKYADITVLDRNLLEVDPDEILAAKTLFTITNGEIGFQSNA